MQALTVCQPWAWAIIEGPKRTENRSWRTNYRGPLVIHAGRGTKWIGTEGDLLPSLPPISELPFGLAVGLVDLVDCVPLAEVAGDPFAFGPWCFVLENPRRFTRPFPLVGKVKLFHVEGSAVDAALSHESHVASL